MFTVAREEFTHTDLCTHAHAYMHTFPILLGSTSSPNEPKILILSLSLLEMACR
jgi:hypothetical protein